MAVGPNRIIKNITSSSITIPETGTIITASGQEDLLLNFSVEQISRFVLGSVYCVNPILGQAVYSAHHLHRL